MTKVEEETQRDPCKYISEAWRKIVFDTHKKKKKQKKLKKFLLIYVCTYIQEEEDELEDV